MRDETVVRRRTEGPEATLSFGGEIAQALRLGDVVGLFGELGSGKTCLVQGICRALEVEGRVTSPTFVMLNEYTGRLRGADIGVYHFDLYRLKTASELEELGYEEYFYGDGICLVEWAERANGLLPRESLRVDLGYVSETVRELVLSGGTDDDRAGYRD